MTPPRPSPAQSAHYLRMYWEAPEEAHRQAAARWGPACLGGLTVHWFVTDHCAALGWTVDDIANMQEAVVEYPGDDPWEAFDVLMGYKEPPKP